MQTDNPQAPEMAERIRELEADVERLRAADYAGDRAIVQLAGCLMATEGNTELDGQHEAFGWSPAYQATVNLRAERADLLEALRQMLDAFGHYDIGPTRLSRAAIAKATGEVQP